MTLEGFKKQHTQQEFKDGQLIPGLITLEPRYEFHGTPGKWILDPYNSRLITTESAKLKVSENISYNILEHVAYLEGNDGIEATANALLMSKSKDMYEQLKKVVRLLSHYNMFDEKIEEIENLLVESTDISTLVTPIEGTPVELSPVLQLTFLEPAVSPAGTSFYIMYFNYRFGRYAAAVLKDQALNFNGVSYAATIRRITSSNGSSMLKELNDLLNYDSDIRDKIKDVICKNSLE